MEHEQVAGVMFTRVSEDGEEGFPGEVKVQAGYFITANSDLIMTWKAELTGGIRDMPTPINLTNHAYWNISGDFKQKTIAEHRLQMNCAKYIPLDDT